MHGVPRFNLLLKVYSESFTPEVDAALICMRRRVIFFLRRCFNFNFVKSTCEDIFFLYNVNYYGIGNRTNCVGNNFRTIMKIIAFVKWGTCM